MLFTKDDGGAGAHPLRYAAFSGFTFAGDLRLKPPQRRLARDEKFPRLGDPDGTYGDVEAEGRSATIGRRTTPNWGGGLGATR